MEKMKQIMYGVTDFALMRAENGYFVFEPQFSRWPEMRHVAILEVKYLKKGGTASVPSADAVVPVAGERDARPYHADATSRVPPEELRAIRDAAAASSAGTNAAW